MRFSLGSGVQHPGFSAACLLAIMLATTPAWAATEVPVWVSLNGHNAEVFQSLAKAYNRSQSDVEVKVRTFDSAAALDQALAAAAGNQSLPALAQIDDGHTLDEVSKRPYIQPLHTLQKSGPLKNVKWFLSSDNAIIHDAKGRLMAFPAMLEVPVMYYNQDAFKKAGLVPAVPQRTWIELQGQLVDLANGGSRQCPLTSDLPVSINLENLAAVNNQLYASADNGLKAKGLPSFSFDLAYVRHLSLMISWVRSEIMTRPGVGSHSVSRFAQGECAVMMSSSGHIGTFNDQRKLHYAVTGLPYYPEVTKVPGNPFVGGAGLWVMKSAKPVTEATTAFLGWLAQPEQAAGWYQKTGYLPVTQAAFADTPVSYYENLGQWRSLVAVYADRSAITGQGFRIHNYPAIRTRFQQILTSALDGDQPAVTALNAATAEGNRLARQP